MVHLCGAVLGHEVGDGLVGKDAELFCVEVHPEHL